MPSIKIGTSLGVWLDGVHGWHNNYRVIELAQDYGFALGKTERECLDAYKRDEGDEWVSVDGATPSDVVTMQGGLVDAATEYLSSQCEEGFHFEWVDGDLLQLADESDEEPHEGHFSALGGTWWCDTCDSPYCDLA